MSSPAAKPPRAARARRAPAPRLTVVSIPSLNPARAEALAPFFDTVFAIASRVARADTATPTAA